MTRPRAGDWLEDELRGLAIVGVHTLVSLLTHDEADELDLLDERGVSEAVGLDYRSLPIRDRDVPTLDGVARAFAEELRDAVAAGRSVAIECRMGTGRSSIIAAATLVLLGVEPAEALLRLGAARGLSVPDTDAQREW